MSGIHRGQNVADDLFRQARVIGHAHNVAVPLRRADLTGFGPGEGQA
jgi:hypothetical protein